MTGRRRRGSAGARAPTRAARGRRRRRTTPPGRARRVRPPSARLREPRAVRNGPPSPPRRHRGSPCAQYGCAAGSGQGRRPADQILASCRGRSSRTGWPVGACRARSGSPSRSTPQLYKLLTDEDAWEPALDANGDVRDGAAVAELTGILDLSGWPDDMRVIVRRERPHPGAQLRFDDVDGYRLTAFATNTRRGQLQQLEPSHRTRARCEDRIRNAKDTGLRNLPLHGFDQNRIGSATPPTVRPEDRRPATAAPRGPLSYPHATISTTTPRQRLRTPEPRTPMKDRG